jgi:hypothetical protein
MKTHHSVCGSSEKAVHSVLTSLGNCRLLMAFSVAVDPSRDVPNANTRCDASGGGETDPICEHSTARSPRVGVLNGCGEVAER